MSKPEYFLYSNPNVGDRWFKVIENEAVLQIVTKVQKKKGRPYQNGVTFISYMTFISSWGWKKTESKYLKPIKKSKFDAQLNKMIRKFQK
jgi:hypothetical protein